MLRVVSCGGLFGRRDSQRGRIVQPGEVDLLAGIADRVRVVLAAAPQCAKVATTPAADMSVDRRAVGGRCGLRMGLHSHGASTSRWGCAAAAGTALSTLVVQTPTQPCVQKIRMRSTFFRAGLTLSS